MKDNEPIKRSQQLAPLSREHHDALVFLLHIKQGLKNGTDRDVICDYMHWFWTNNLANHFEQEEKLLLPQLPADDDLAIQLKKEHEAIRRLQAGPLSETDIMLFTEMLNAHIRFEERQLFPHIEARLSVEILNQILEQLDYATQCQSDWNNKFWNHRNS